MEQFCKENWKQYTKRINGTIDTKYRHIEAGCGFMPKEPHRINEGFILSGFISEPNAALIVAAPDLYAALKHLLTSLEQDEYQESAKAMVLAREAIFKAENYRISSGNDFVPT